MGVNSSDVYYVNQDKRQAHKAELKGGAKIAAASLRNNHGEKLTAK
jgi:hypothetical protein